MLDIFAPPSTRSFYKHKNLTTCKVPRSFAREANYPQLLRNLKSFLLFRCNWAIWVIFSKSSGSTNTRASTTRPSLHHHHHLAPRNHCFKLLDNSVLCLRTFATRKCARNLIVVRSIPPSYIGSLTFVITFSPTTRHGSNLIKWLSCCPWTHHHPIQHS